MIPLVFLRCFSFIFLAVTHVRSLMAADDQDSAHVQASKVQCPRLCECSLLNNSRGLVVRCRGESYHTLSTLPKERVEVLNLSDSGIRTLSPELFKGFSRLRILDLSRNELETLQSNWFEHVRQLEELLLANNPLQAVPEKSLEPLTNLKYMDLATPYLTCDCNMKWFRRWIVKAKVRSGRASTKRPRVTLSSGTICYFPARLRGKLFIETARKGLVCSGILDPASFSVQPTTSRLIPEGGNVSLKCNVSTMKDSEILEWLRNGRPIVVPSPYEMHTYFADGGQFHVSALHIINFRAADEGKWSCRLETPKGSVQRSVDILILHNNSSRHMCPAESSVDRKGSFLWPATFASSKAEVSCPQSLREAVTAGPIKNASRQCREDASWSEPITEQCDYESLIFRRLNGIKEGQIVGDRRKDVEMVLEALRNVTMEMCANSGNVPDADDVNLALHLMEKMALTAKESEERIMLDIVNDLLKVKASILSRADHLYRTARRLLNILRSSSTSIARSQFAIEDCSIPIDDEAGVVVTYVENGKTADTGELKCFARDSDEEGRWLEPALSMDIVLAFSAEIQSSSLVVPLRFLWYRNGGVLSRLVLRNNTQGGGDWVPYQSVIGVVSNRFADIGGFIESNSSGYMVLRWKWRPTRNIDMTSVKLAFLVMDYKMGPLRWTPFDECSPSATSRSIAFSCPLMLGLFTLIRKQDSDGKKRASDEWPISLAPWVLASSGFAVACLLSSALIYCCCHRSIQFSVKLCHALVNCWLALAILVLTFALGIDRLTEETLCMVVAVLLHYATLAVTLWFFLVIRTLQRKLRKLAYPKKADLSDGEMVSYNDGRPKPRHGPLVGMYFLAWGLPAMPCAFTLPLRMDSYTSNEELCFMEANFIALVAFAIPVVVLALTISLLLANAFRYQRELESRRNRSEVIRTDLTVVADESDGNVTSNRPVPLVSSTADNADAFSSVSTEIGDEDGGARRHLITMGAAFVLTLLSYGFGAALVTRPWLLVNLEHLERYFLWTFGGLYALSISLLGLIILWSYVLGRQSVTADFMKRKMIRREADSAVVLRRPKAENGHRKAPPHRRSRPPTVAPSCPGPIDGAVSYRQGSVMDSVCEQSADVSIDPRTVNAGTTMTRPPSQQSGTIAPSGTNVSTARTHRMQQAVAKKYYEKQRALKMNSSTMGTEDGDDAEAGEKRAPDTQAAIENTGTGIDDGENLDDDSTVGADNGRSKLREISNASAERNSYNDFDDASAFSRLSSLSRNVDPLSKNGKVEKRRPSVELYRKPTSASKAVVHAIRNGPVTLAHQSGSDEDSTPEALRNLDQNGGRERNDHGGNSVLDTTVAAGGRKSLRVCGTNETSV